MRLRPRALVVSMLAASAAFAGDPSCVESCKDVGGLEDVRKFEPHVAHALGGRGFGACFFVSACSASRRR
jgi:hypothetical protein